MIQHVIVYKKRLTDPLDDLEHRYFRSCQTAHTLASSIPHRASISRRTHGTCCLLLRTMDSRLLSRTVLQIRIPTLHFASGSSFHKLLAQLQLSSSFFSFCLLYLFSTKGARNSICFDERSRKFLNVEVTCTPFFFCDECNMYTVK
jgi:hypothetical protein